MFLTDGQGGEVVSLARETLDQYVRGQPQRRRGEWDQGFLNERKGVFVTLKMEDSSLRGCIGFPYPVKALGDGVVEATMAAAAQDPRFPPVREPELNDILVEASVLSTPRPLLVGRPAELPNLVRIGVDGLIVAADGHSGLLLPQVASELRLTAEEFLSEACMKAGLMPDAWLMTGVSVQVFQADVFAELSPRGTVRRDVPSEG